MRQRRAKGDEREGSRLYGRRVDEGCRVRGAKGKERMGGWKRSKPSVPGRGAARERRWRLALDDAHHVVVIDVRGYETYSGEGYRNPDTLDTACCDDNRENGKLDVRWRTYPVNVVGAPRREKRIALPRGTRTRTQVARLPRGERIRPTNLFSRGRG